MISPKLLLIVLIVSCTVHATYAAIYPSIGTCFSTCSQCKKFLGVYFDLQLCDEYCLKFRGKMTPDIEDTDTLAPFITNLSKM